MLAGTGLSHLAQCETPPPPAQQTGSAVVTIVTDNSPHGDEDPLPEPKRCANCFPIWHSMACCVCVCVCVSQAASAVTH